MGDTAASGLVWAAVAVWGVLGVYVTITDMRRAVIPRRAVWSAGIVVAALLGSAALVAGDFARFGWAVVAAASTAIVLEILWRLGPERIGYGDVRLMIVNSLLAGWWGPVWAWWALLAGAAAQWPAAWMALVRHSRGSKVRWAPGLVAGTAAVVAYKLWRDGPLP